jgi:hypothetical protein
MGQSIFKIACPEDYEQIRDNLKYQENTSSEGKFNIFHFHSHL